MRTLMKTIAIAIALTSSGAAQVAASEAPGLLGFPLQCVPTLAPLVKQVTPSVGNIAIKGRVAQEQNPLSNDPFFRRFFDLPDIPAEREIRAAGSGVIVDARQGLVITNNPVVEHASEISVILTDGRKLEGKKIGADPGTDVAVIKIPAENLTALPLGDSDKLEVGDFVVAIGNPFGLGQTVTCLLWSRRWRLQLSISALRASSSSVSGLAKEIAFCHTGISSIG